MSEREASRMLERMRANEEDEEFERAFRSMVRTSTYNVCSCSVLFELVA